MNVEPIASCKDDEPHQAHNWVDTDAVMTCSGRTDCGAWSHKAHEVKVNRDYWCPGRV